jgi:hypothetical protein
MIGAKSTDDHLKAIRSFETDPAAAWHAPVTSAERSLPPRSAID